LNSKAYQFSQFVAPKYPALAQAPRIQGNVELQLHVDPATGTVSDASAVAGHPLLEPSAVEAAKQWRFAPGSVNAEPLRLTVDYELRCP